MITRRGVLAAGASALALGGACGRSRGVPPAALDLQDPAARLRALMLMRGALDERLVIGFVSGRYHGVVDSVLTPLYGVLGATFSRYRAMPDGSYLGASFEVPYFTDLASGEVLDRFANPYTGETVEVPQKGFPPSLLTIAPDLMITLPHRPAGLTFTDRVLPPEHYGDDVWMVEAVSSAFVLAPHSKPVRYNEITTLHARAADLRQAHAGRVACQTSFHAIVSWRPWLHMGDRPGHLSGDGFGCYGAELADLPPAWHRATRSRDPGILDDPASVLAPVWPPR